MTQDEIIEMAKKAGFDVAPDEWHWLEAFANLVAQHEREACAKHLENMSNAPDVKSYADSIRARGQ